MKMTWCSFSRNILIVFLVLSSFFAVLAASSSDVSVPATSEGQSNAVQGRVQLEKSQPAIDEIGPRVVNGTDVPLNTYPWYTRLLIDDVFLCGGILVAPDYVLTAAHCIFSDYIYTAQVGALCEPFESGDNCEQDVEEFGILDFIVHPDYDDPYVPNNDYALIRLNGNSTIQPVMIDSGAFSPTYTEEKQLWGIGLGDLVSNGTYPDHLQHVELSYITNENCVSVYEELVSGVFLPELGVDINSMMCTFTPFKSPCFGDSGGPLYDSENDVVVGIVSWGFGCADDFPGVYARISTHFPWIRENICANSPSASICGVSIPPTVSPSPTVSLSPTATTCDVDEFKLAIRADLFPGPQQFSNYYAANILQYDIYSPNGTLLDSGSLSSLDNEENVACFPKSTSCDNNYKLTLEDSSGEDSSLTWDGNNVTVEVDDEIVFEADLFEDIFNAPDFEIEFGVFQAPGNSSCAPSLSPVPSISPTTNDEFCSIEDHFELVIVFHTDYYPSDSAWNITDDNGDVIAVEGSFAEGGKLHVDKFCFPENCDAIDSSYTINFIDFFGDGISGGYYKVVVNGERVDTGGDDFLNAYLNSEHVSTCPSSATTSSTSPSAAPCSENEIFISAEVKTDKYPFETSFALFSGVGNGAEEIERIDPSEPNEVTMASRCVPELGQYTFRIDDAAGDGLNDASEAGFFKVFVDGVQVFGDSDGTNFGFSDVVIIDSASASPSKSPTASPTTRSPSKSPTPSPTGSPSISPTPSPTTRSPSISPTPSPTGSPSISPTASPTTRSPSKSPTPSPTGSPSISPTPSPTRSPTISPAEDTKSTKGSKGTKDSTKGTKGTYSY